MASSLARRLHDVPVEALAVAGERRMRAGDVLSLARGATIRFPGPLSETVQLRVADRLIATGVIQTEDLLIRLAINTLCS